MSARPEAPIRDLLDGLTALVRCCLGGGQAVLLALDEDGTLQHAGPSNAAPDLVSRALARSGSSLRSVGGDPPASRANAPSDFGPTLCVPVYCQEQIVGVLYAETGSAASTFPPELLGRLRDAEALPDPALADPPTPNGVANDAAGADPAPAPPPLRSLAELERDAILDTLRACRGNRTASARVLGISVRKLQYRLKEYAEQGSVISEPPC